VCLVLVAVVFGVLNVLTLAGSRVALGLLAALSAGLVGAGIAYLASLFLVPKGAVPGSPRRLVGFMIGVASVFGIPFVGAALFGIPPFPTAEGGNVGHAVHGFSYGFGLALARFSIGPGGTPRRRASAPEEKAWARVLLVVVGALAALSVLAFVASLLFRYVLGPLVRAAS
jgi:hypothetical protein